MSEFTNAIFDKVLNLKNDQTLTLTFDSKKDLMSKKVTFYRERKEYAKAFPGNDIFIQQRIVDATATYELILSNSISGVSWMASAVIRNADGTCEKVFIENKAVVKTESKETARIRTLMQEDGCSEEEINETIAALNTIEVKENTVDSENI
jgi:hypothetical protein